MYSLKRKSLRIKSRITILREAIQAPVIIQVTDETPVTGARGIITVREITAIITVRGITITRGYGRNNNFGGQRAGQNQGQRNDRGQGTGQRQGGNDRRQSGNDSQKVFERFKKSQSGFDSIKQEQKPGRSQRAGKDNQKKR